jgi:hypothetical protein
MTEAGESVEIEIGGSIDSKDYVNIIHHKREIKKPYRIAKATNTV